MTWQLEQGAEMVDHHVRFTARWDGRQHHVFVATVLLEELAGHSLTRSAAVAYVDDHVARFVEAAQRRALEAGSHPTTIALEGAADLG